MGLFSGHAGRKRQGVKKHHRDLCRGRHRLAFPESLETRQVMTASDINVDGLVDAADAAQLFADWQTNAPAADINRDGIVDAADAGALFRDWTVSSVQSGDYAVTNETLTKWLELGGEEGIGRPTGPAQTNPLGEVSQPFEGGEIRWSETDGYSVSDSRMMQFLSTPTSVAAAPHTRRPTLLVITQGAETGGHYTYQWQIDLAQNLRERLEQEDSQVHSMIVQWDSFRPNDVGVQYVARTVRDWLSARSQAWDVVLVGHSRGAIFNHELVQELSGNSKINQLQHILLDPTASIVHGDQYPGSIPTDVDNAAVYDDGYVFVPLAVNDGHPIPGAEYHRISVPGYGPNDPGSHNAIAKWYAREGYQQDANWLVAQKRPQSSAPYVHETLTVGNQVIIAPGPAGARNVVDIGLDTNENGNIHGWVTTPIFGVDVTIGKNGLDIGGGMPVVGSGAVSLSSRGWMVNVNVGNFAQGGVIIGTDETRIDVNVLGMNINLFGKDAGVSFGGKKVTLKTDAQLSPGTVVLESHKVGEFVRDKFAQGVQVGRETWSNGRKTVQGWLDNSGQWISQQLDGLGNVLEQFTYFGGYGSQLYQWRNWTADGALTGLEEFTSSGAKIVDKWLNSSGQWISQQLDGLGNVLEQFTYFGGYGSQLYQWRKWTADGALTGLEEFTSSGAKIVDKWLNSSGQWISQQLDGLGNVLEQFTYFGGYGSQLYQWRKWTADGALTGLEEFTSSGAKIVDKWLNSSGQWISQKLDGLGHVLEQYTYFGGYGSQLYQWRKWTADGALTGFEEFTSSGAKIVDKWLNSSGQWISQQLDGAGNVLKQWVYYAGNGSQLREWATWSGQKLTNLERYSSSGVKTLDAYISTTGNWVERLYNSSGVEYAVKVWNSAGTYLGDQYKNWSDAASRLDPTTSSWWPF